MVRPEVELARTKAEYKAKQQIQNEFDAEVKRRTENIRGTRDEILELTETLDRKLKNGEITHDQAIELVKKYDEKYAKMAQENPGAYKSKYDRFNSQVYDTIAKYEEAQKIDSSKANILQPKDELAQRTKNILSSRKAEFTLGKDRKVSKILKPKK